jgi:hypothetical protein
VKRPLTTVVSRSAVLHSLSSRSFPK